MANILIVDDEIRLRETLVEYFEHAGHTCFEGSDGIDAITQVKNEHIDLVILDIMMPNMDGKEACRLIKNYKSIPVIFLSARDKEIDMLEGFAIQADDYMTKPFSPKVVVAKAEALLRLYNNSPTHHIIVAGELTLDLTSSSITCCGEKMSLSAIEFDLLSFFIQHKNQLFSRTQLLESVWGYNQPEDSKTVTTHLSRIGKKLGPMSSYIVNERGRGYKLEVPHV